MQTNHFTKSVAGLGALMLVGASATAIAQMEGGDMLVDAERATHMAELSGGNEVPAVDAAGTGTAWIIADPQNNTVRWTVEYSDLTGEVTGAHFHGPAGPEENADVVLSLTEGDDDIDQALQSPIEGQAELTQDQFDQLMDGQWYVNIHTEANPGGEIRGQVEPVIEGSGGM